MPRRNRKRISWAKRLRWLRQRCLQSSGCQRLLALWQRLPCLHQRALSLLLPLLLVVIIWPFPVPQPNAAEAGIDPAKQRIPLQLSLDAQATEPSDAGVSARPQAQPAHEQPQPKVAESSAAPSRLLAWQQYQIQPGDTLTRVFRRQGLSLSELGQLVQVQGTDKPLNRLHRGQMLRYRINASGQLVELQLEQDSHHIHFVRLASGDYARR